MAYKSFEEFDAANQHWKKALFTTDKHWKKALFTTDKQCQALYNMQRALGEPIKWPYRQDEAKVEFERLQAMFKPKKLKGGGYNYDYDYADFNDIF